MDAHALDSGALGFTPEELVAHSRWLTAVARALLADDVADDLAQEAWVAALERRPAKQESLKPWLFGALRFLALNQRRERARREAREALAASAEALPASDELPAQIELQRLIAEAVSALPEPERSTLVKRYWLGLSAAEIARQEHVPAGTVRARLSRALARLRERLDQRFHGDRSAWSALLLPLARRAPAGSATSTAAGTGALGLGTLLTCAACVTVGLVGWLLWPTPEAREVTEVASLLSDETSGSEDPAPDSRATADETATRLDAAARLAAALDPAAATPASVPPAVLVARIIGPHETPLAGAHLRVRGQENDPLRDRTGITDASGRVRLVLDLTGLLEHGAQPTSADRLSRHIELDATAPAHTLRELGATIAPGQTIELGDIALEPAGTLSGRLVDEGGRPLRGLAYATLSDLPAELRDSSGHRGPPEGTRLSSAPCGQDGRFQLEFVRAGTCRVWCGAEGRLWAHSAALELTAGATLDCGDVVVRTNPFAIHGRVEDPSGHPLEHQEVLFGSAATASWIGTSSDASGAFVIELEGEGPCDLMTEGESDKYTPTLLRAVPAGSQGVVLRTTPPAFVELEVRDDAGAPIEYYTLAIGLEPGQSWTSERTVRPGGRARVLVHPVPFWISVEAPGCAPEERGPFELSAGGTKLALTLHRIPSVSGRVTLHGAPVADVQLILAHVLRPGEDWVANEVPLQLSKTPEWLYGRSDADGRFTISTPERGRFRVLAWAEELPGARTPEFTLDGGQAPAELQLALDAAGVLAGRVLGPPESARSGLFIGLSNGDGRTLMARTDAGGAWRFENLEPGRWWVRKLEEDLSGTTRFRHRDEYWREPPSVVVEAGRTTHFDLDPAQAGGGTLAGRLRFGNTGTRGWTAALELSGNRRVVALDERGAFRFEFERLGQAQLVLSDVPASGVQHELRTALELEPGEHPVTLDFDAASVRGRAARHAGQELALVRRDGAQQAFVTRFTVDSAGAFGPLTVCAGHLALVRVLAAGNLGPDVLLELDLAAGETRALELP